MKSVLHGFGPVELSRTREIFATHKLPSHPQLKNLIWIEQRYKFEMPTANDFNQWTSYSFQVLLSNL